MCLAYYQKYDTYYSFKPIFMYFYFIIMSVELHLILNLY